MWNNCTQKAPKHPFVSTPDFKTLKKQTIFSMSELKKLFSRYVSLCNEAGQLEASEFLLQPELSFTPLASLMFYYESDVTTFPMTWINNTNNMTIGCEATINFEKFVNIVNILSPKTDVKKKYECKLV